MAKLEFIRGGKLMRVETNVLVVIERELIAFTRKWQRPPSGVLLGPHEYLALAAEFERQTGKQTPRGEQMFFCSIPAGAKVKPGWDFLIPAELTHYFVPGVVQGDK